MRPQIPLDLSPAALPSFPGGDFHPIIQGWFRERLGEPSAPQREGWPAIQAGEDVLIAAPTGSGKTLAAFLAAIDRLFRQALENRLTDQTQVVYVSPLKALGNDVQKNLLEPLAQITERARKHGLAPQEIRVQVRTGDTSATERAAMVKRPPHILITTPESLYLYLTGIKARETLRTVETVIVDEIHALARDKRGPHLALSLERLALLTHVRPQRVGLSATVKPLEQVASFLVGVSGQSAAQSHSTRVPSTALHSTSVPSTCVHSTCGSGLLTATGHRDSRGPSTGSGETAPTGQGSQGQNPKIPDPQISDPQIPDPQVPPSQTWARTQLAPCRLVQAGHTRPWELSIEIPDAELSAVASHEMWGQLYDRMVELSASHRTILVFANTRKMSERVAHDLSERLGEGTVAAHHGSMSKELRLAAEEKLKKGQLKVMVATASLELGIDIGDVDLVIQLGTPRAISVLLQRIGRAGHRLGGISKGIVFATTRDELVECTALLRAVKEGTLDAVLMPQQPLDVLAQQIVAACANEDWDERRLYSVFRRAWQYRDLSLEEYEEVLEMLSEGIATSRGRARVHLHRDRVNHVIKARKGARITAVTNGGAIPETFTYPVIAEPEGKQVGTLDEDFAVESMAGDVFLLGSTSWRIRSVRGSAVYVEDARGQPPSVPFWLGEAPSRTKELSFEVGRLREDLLAHPDPAAWLAELKLSPPAADALVAYVRLGNQVLGALPSTNTVVAERFFDEAGGMQLILHAPFGGRLNRAWGLALRKRFCRSFDFELQAAASDDGILLSMGEQHSFPLEDIFEFLTAETVEDVLVQAVLQAPLFGTRFRWNATRALALSRMSGGKKVPPHLQRLRSDDLLASVFPAQVGCQDNHGGGPIEVPDHPLVRETVDNCLREALDVDGLKEVLTKLKDGRIRTVARDLPEPSPFAHAMLNSAPYTFLDDAPLEERRARAVVVRRTLPAEDAAAFGALDANAITQVIEDARPPMRDAEELHDALLQLGLMPDRGVDPAAWSQLVGQGRVARLSVDGVPLLVATERIPIADAIFPAAPRTPDLKPLAGDAPLGREDALRSVVRGHMELCGPTTARELAAYLGLPEDEVNLALFQIEAQGQVLRGQFRPEGHRPPVHLERSEAESKGQETSDRVAGPSTGSGRAEVGTAGPSTGSGRAATTPELEWCDRRLLQRIHRLTVGRLRKEIAPLTAQDFMRFLFKWHHLEPGDQLRGTGGMLKAISLLQGYEAPAAAWELSLLPARMRPYLPELLEKVCWSGEVAFARLSVREAKPEPGPKRGAVVEMPLAKRAAPNRSANLTFVRREELDWLIAASRPTSPDGVVLPDDLSHPAREVAQALQRRGASFFHELVSASKRLASEVEDGLWELLGRGLITADALENLRVLQSPKRRKRQRAMGRGGPGRWSLLSPLETPERAQVVSQLAKLFLQRYGIVFREVVSREPLAPPWRELASVYRRMEARGEIRGGRFLAGQVGEQFALPDAVDLARAMRRSPPSGLRIHLAAVDPLNLTGIVTPGPRVPAQLGGYVTYLDGVPVTERDLEQPRGSALAH